MQPMADSTIVFAVLAGVVVLFVSGRVPVDLVAIGSALALWATGVLELDDALGGFGDPTVLYIAALFVVSEALDATGITTWAGQRLVSVAGTSKPRLLVLLMALAAGLTAVISVNGAVAALLPVVVVLAVKLRRPASELLMPMAFAAHAGSMLALTGTPVNVIVSEAAHDSGHDYFGFFEFALAGVPLVLGTVGLIVLLGDRLLPARTTRSIPKDFSDHARTLVGQYRVDESAGPLYDRYGGVAELVVAPRSSMVGQTAFPGMVTESGDLVILAVQRHGQDLGAGSSLLAAGDTLLVQGTWDALSANIDDDPGVLVVDNPQLVRRQALPLGPGARRVGVVLVGLVAMLATGAVPPAAAGLLAAGALVLSGVVTIDRAYRSVSWTTVVLVAGMIPLSTAMRTSGAAEQIADRLVDVVGDSGPYPLLIGVFVLTAILGQLVSNTATSLIVIPIALSAAATLDVSTLPVLMSLNVASSAALLSPMATPANMMVMGPGGYRFGDYARLGVPVMAWFFVVAIGVVPLFWPL
jgi:di/tricarboxylate transporter